MALIQSVIEQGLIYAIMALGIYITYTILDFPDLTGRWQFPYGSGTLRRLLISPKGFNSLLTLPICIFGRSTHWQAFNRTDSCKIKGKRFTFRYYYDDSTLYRESSELQEEQTCRFIIIRIFLKMQW